MYGEIKREACDANKMLPQHGLVKFTWGNVSQRDTKKSVFAIKPSGVEYADLVSSKMVVLDIMGNVLDGDMKPSSDTHTHRALYEAFSEIGGIVHTHSSYATAWAQAGRDIPCYGTTHADYFYGNIPCIRFLTEKEINDAYEWNTGKVICDYFKEADRDILSVPGVLCRGHGVFAWGKNAEEAVHNAVVIEEVAKMAFLTEQINCDVEVLPSVIRDKHYFRKHGSNAYYGQ